jgi:cytochrome b involved in lipid metabolism
MIKYIKSAFLISLFNFVIVGSIILAFKKPEPQFTPVNVIVEPTPTVIATEIKNRPRTNENVVTKATPTKTEVVVDNRCIILVDSVQYDITRFKSDHSGGDIFQCGTDMSSIFHGQHDNSFIGKMARYRI